MHYYKFNIADYRKDTGHLSTIEHGIYRQLIDWYYLDEQPIPLETQVVIRRLRLGSDDLIFVENVLADFFQKTVKGYVHKRIEFDIKEYHLQADKNKANGKRGGRPKKTQSVISGLPDESQNNPNHKPETINHKPKKEATDVAIVLPDWIPLETWQAYLAMRKRIKKPPTDYAVKLLINKLDGFRAKGQDVKEILERSITSSWQDLYEIAPVKQPFNKFDAITTTVPGSKEKDPALVKLDEDAKKAAAPSLETLQRLAALRQELKNG
jgi:uncharacterized protein YdaU (DUF1376 family)